MIPKGEKSETFTDLALVFYEGRTLKGLRVSDEYLKELGTILGSVDTAHKILVPWLGMVQVYGDAPKNSFTGGESRTDAKQLKQLTAVLGHIDALMPFLNDRLAWVTACASPEILEDPEIATEYEHRIGAIKESLDWLRSNVNTAKVKIPPIKAGRSLELTSKLMLLLSLVANLKEAEIPMGTGERSKMVRAVRICWDAAEFEDDPRDLLRSLEKRGAQIANLR